MVLHIKVNVTEVDEHSEEDSTLRAELVTWGEIDADETQDDNSKSVIEDDLDLESLGVKELLFLLHNVNPNPDSFQSLLTSYANGPSNPTLPRLIRRTLEVIIYGHTNFTSTFTVSFPSAHMVTVIPSCAPTSLEEAEASSSKAYDTVRVTIATPLAFWDLDLLELTTILGATFHKQALISTPDSSQPSDDELSVLFFWIALNIAHEVQDIDALRKSFHFLGHGLSHQYIVSGKEEHLQCAVDVMQSAIDLCNPEDSDDMGHMLGETAKWIVELVSKFGVGEEPSASLSWCRHYVTTQTLPESQEAYAQLAGVFMDCAKLLGLESDYAIAVNLQRQALRLCPEDAENFSKMVYNLGTVVLLRFQNFRNIGDLEECIQLYRRAAALEQLVADAKGIDGYEPCPEYVLGGGLGQILSGLAGAILVRYHTLGRMDDLIESIKLHRQVLAFIPGNHPVRYLPLVTLAPLLGDIGEFDEAIALNREGLKLAPSSHTHNPIRLLNFAAVLLQRFDNHLVKEDVRYIDEAIQLLTTALELFDSRPDRIIGLQCLGRAYFARFKGLKDHSDATTGLQYLHRAVDDLRAEPGRANLTKYLCVLAEMYGHPDAPYHNLETAFEVLSEALDDSLCNPQHRLYYFRIALRKMPRISLPQNTANKLADVLVKAAHLLPQVAYFGLDLESRLLALKESDGQLVAMASGLLMMLERYTEAIELIEAGRAIFWSQALCLRTQFDELPEDIKENLLCLSKQLERESFSDTLSQRSQEAMEADTARRRKLSEEFNSGVEAARALPGHENFMQPSPLSELSAVVSEGPVVLLMAESNSIHAIVMQLDEDHQCNITPMRLELEFMDLYKWSTSLKLSSQMCRGDEQSKSALGQIDKDEVLLLEEEDQHDENEEGLENITRGDRAGRFARRYSVTRRILRLIWEKIVEPVIQVLGLEESSGRERPRLWWCPTGPFTFLPLHAAGTSREDGADKCCSDYFVSSYTPTLSALINARRNFQPIPRADAKILLAAVPKPFHGVPLSGARQEVEEISRIIPASNILAIPPEDDVLHNPQNGVQIQTMLDRIPEATILHLACHGNQDHNLPLESGFMMRDGTLSISKLVPLNLEHAFLAFLSACETAKGDQDQPDQTIHLAAAMLFTGFKSVIATQWLMDDEDGPLVARIVYEELFKEDEDPMLDPDAVPYALDDAVRKLKASGVSPERWAPFIHLGV